MKTLGVARGRLGSALILSFVVLQAIFIIMLLGFDVPYRDEWDSIIRALIQKETNGFEWTQLLLPVVEHRLPLPMTVFQILSTPRYYPVVLMVINALVHIAGWLCFRSTMATGETSEPLPFAFQCLVVSMFFHFAQYINYTMGVQLFWVLGPVATHFFIRGLLRRSATLAISAHLIGTFSFPVWPIHFLLFVGWAVWMLWHRRIREVRSFAIKVGIILLATGVVTLGFLYAKSGPGASVDLLKIAKFFLFVLASALSRYKEGLAWILGPLFLTFLIVIFRRGPRFVSPLVYYLYGILTLSASFLIAYGRHVYDPSYAFGGHYLILTAPGWCIVLIEALGLIANRKWATILSVGLCTYVLGLGARALYKDYRDRRPLLIEAKACIREGREREESCRPAMQEIFLIGIEEKLEMTDNARNQGIYP